MKHVVILLLLSNYELSMMQEKPSTPPDRGIPAITEPPSLKNYRDTAATNRREDIEKANKAAQEAYNAFHAIFILAIEGTETILQNASIAAEDSAQAAQNTRNAKHASDRALFLDCALSAAQTAQNLLLEVQRFTEN